jgi:hypothetical protein
MPSMGMVVHNRVVYGQISYLTVLHMPCPRTGVTQSACPLAVNYREQIK